LQFSEKGAFRWYAACCNTPIGNTAKPSVPFIGLISAFIDMDASTKDAQIGPVRSHCQTQHAADSWPPEHKRNGFPLGLTARMMALILGWKMRGLGKDNPLFTAAGDPIAQPHSGA
jgi:hypothetical protein